MTDGWMDVMLCDVEKWGVEWNGRWDGGYGWLSCYLSIAC